MCKITNQLNNFFGFKALLGLFILVSSAQVQSQTVDFDPNVELNSGEGIVNVLTLQDDGKIFVAGTFDSVGQVARDELARIESNGDLDLSFNEVFVNGSILAVAIEPAGSVIVGGSFTQVEDIQEAYIRRRIVRFDANGIIDPNFNPIVNRVITSILIQGDGKIIIGGDFTDIGGVPAGRLARLNTDGSVDTTFINPNINGQVNQIAMQDDGQLVIRGDFSTVGGQSRQKVARLNGIDGSLDVTFIDPAVVGGSLTTLAVQDNGGIIIGGVFGSVGQFVRNHVTRLNPDGSLDTEFGRSLQNFSRVRTIKLQNDGKILVGGRLMSSDASPDEIFLLRLLENGDVDFEFDPVLTTLGDVNSAIMPTVTSLLIQDDDQIVFGGSFITINQFLRNSMARVDIDGRLDAVEEEFCLPIKSTSGAISVTCF